jgi:hypothetical protein
MKRIWRYALIIILLFGSSTVTAVAAKEALVLHLENYNVQENQISVYFNTNLNQEVTASKLKLTIEGEELPIKEIKTVEDAKQGISYLFMIDISGSIKDDKLLDMKEILGSFASRMSDGDNAAIMLVGNDYEVSDFVTGKNNLEAQIDSITMSSQDTNLYAAIVNALSILNTNPSVQTKKCLVILSDGKDDFTTGYTLDEVNIKINEANTPIHTIALLEEDASIDLIEAAKVLGSFARLSAGGIDITYGIDGITSDDVSDKINHSMKQSYILTADTSLLDLNESESYLELTLDADENGIVSDGFSIISSTLQTQTSSSKEEENTASESTAETVEEEQGDESQTNTQNPGFASAIGIAVGVIISLILFLLLKGKRGKKRSSKLSIENNSMEEENNEKHQNTTINIRKPVNQIELHFTKIGLVEGQTYTVSFEKDLIIGRNSEKAQLFFKEDDLLSSQHCKIIYRDNKLFIEDMNSTNGTFVNGVPAFQSHQLEQDDVILIGSMELRINWTIV